jgi:hypothetical protein
LITSKHQSCNFAENRGYLAERACRNPPEVVPDGSKNKSQHWLNPGQ